jgi:hypothetical protein
MASVCAGVDHATRSLRRGITTVGRDGRFWMSVTMTTVVASRPG